MKRQNDERDIPLAPPIEPEEAISASLVMSGIAYERNDPCGLRIVLDALGITEMVREIRHDQTS